MATVPAPPSMTRYRRLVEAATEVEVHCPVPFLQAQAWHLLPLMYDVKVRYLLSSSCTPKTRCWTVLASVKAKSASIRISPST